jgi:hypothetical protein
MSDTQWTPLERAILKIIQNGASRCGAGFGQYPLGVREALRELEPFIATDDVRQQLRNFDERLAR